KDDGYATACPIIFICTNERLKAWEYTERVQVDIMVLRKTTRNEEVRMMGHDHHDHTHGANKKALLLRFILIASFMVIEAIGGWLTNSLALLADAGHMFSDAVSLAIALVAFKFGEKVADYSKTYGYKRFEILAAVFNGVTLVLISLFIFYEFESHKCNSKRDCITEHVARI